MNNISYVTKKETKPYKTEFNQLFQKIKQYFVDDFSLTYQLVGSSKRNLVISHHNKGFDLDYQIIIQKIKNQEKWKNPNKIKDKFFKFIQNQLQQKYTIENSTSAITLKKLDTINSKIKVGFDIVILKEINNNYEILKRSINDNYNFQKMTEHKDFRNNFRKIKDKQLWNELRKKYLENKIKIIKENSDEKSYFTLIKTVKTIIDNLDKY
ncbi:hypothetical protein [Spiroplasma sp. AdecLV25b]|uniref:hypothetical protein n=1 Tax=Spiroplasma sp. AdecLV25b TaxID=3027162 RepID=UPI0027E08684|nr:hypothetical protein [Spiroplasma sp. AdecLV25b]